MEDSYISVLVFCLVLGNCYCLSRGFRKNVNAGFRQKEGLDIPEKSFIQCAVMCNIQRCSNFYYKKETNACNLGTYYAVSPVSDPQQDWSYFDEPTEGRTNVALNKITTQSSQFNSVLDHGPQFAVDGDVTNLDGGVHGTHTQTEFQPWLKIDLGSNKRIDKVLLFSHHDQNGIHNSPI